jgi:diguanylate cyclase (GGDEF)-like protein
VARTYWLLINAAFAIFGFANAIWVYQASSGAELPFQPALLFSYRFYAAPLAMTLFLRPDQESGRYRQAASLDLLQIGVIISLVFFTLFYFPAKALSSPEVRQLGVVRIGNGVNLSLLAATYIRWRIELDPALRQLRGRLVALVAVYGFVSAVGNSIDSFAKPALTLWFDIAWAVPYLVAAGLALNWEAPPEMPASQPGLPRSFASLITENLTVALLVLAVAILSDRVPEPWHSLANVAVGISLIAYSTRLTLSQRHQQRELQVRQHAEDELLRARDELARSLLNANQRAIAIREWGSASPVGKAFEPNQCWAIRRGRVHNGDRRASPISCSHLADDETRIALCVPLVTHGEIFGILVLLRNRGQLLVAGDLPARALAKARRIGRAVAEQLALTLANLKLRAALRDQAIRDPLTGLFNRRYLEETLNRELQRACRQGRAVSLLMLDLDHFKRLNDNFGHDAGDLVLRAIGEFLRSRTRTEDIACRCGGEEFVIIMPDAALENASRRAREICDGIKQFKIEHQSRTMDPVTVSVGVACSSPSVASVASLLKAADIALYRAKREGRDRVVVSETVRNETEVPLLDAIH